MKDNNYGIEEKIKKSHCVQITRQAFTKINLYAMAISQILDMPTEINGLLIGCPGDLSCTAVDAYLLPDQNVENYRAFPDTNAFSSAYAWAEKSNKRIVGMWHSHGCFNNFHSGDDDNHLMDILINNSYVLKTKLGISGTETPYACSIVVNENSYLRKDPSQCPLQREHYFCCVGFRDENDEKRVAYDLEIRIVDHEDQDMPEYEEMVLEICRKVKYGGVYIKDLVEDSAAGPEEYYKVGEKELNTNDAVADSKDSAEKNYSEKHDGFCEKHEFFLRKYLRVIRTFFLGGA